MVIFREKLFRRDIITDEVKIDLIDDPEKVKLYGPPISKLIASKLYNKQRRTFGPAINKFRIKQLLKDIKRGYIYKDGPAGGQTHILGDYSILGKFYVFSKKIDKNHRLNYRVYPPKVLINAKTNQKQYIKLIIIESCWEHNINEGDYLNDQELRARKDRMRKNAPYRKNSKSIMSKKK